MAEIMHEYELIAPFQNKNAGFSRWTFAKKKGKTYFLKEFIDPVYPIGAPISDELRQRRIEECEQFEQQKSRIYQAINRASDGNLVRIEEFFRCNTHYYLVMEKVEAKSLSFEEIAKKPFIYRALLCRSIAHAVMQLHKEHLVHTDIKETNILVKETAAGMLVGKIIDLDSAFFEGKPPVNEDDLGGDQVYISPEAVMFLCGEEAELTCKMDVFALGLLFHQYLTGELPQFDKNEYDYPHEAVLDDHELLLSQRLNSELTGLISRMLVKDPKKRVDMTEVYERLGLYFEIEKKPEPKVTARVAPDYGRTIRFDGPPVETGPADPEASASGAGWFSAGGDL